MKKKPTRPTPSTHSIRYNEADLELIEKLKEKTGVVKTAELVRMGLRALAEKLGVKV